MPKGQPRRKFKVPEVCKPCWELKYCPYGVIVEMMPLPAATQNGKGRFDPAADDVDGQDRLYEKAKTMLQQTDFANDDQLWNNIFFVMYADPTKWEVVGD